MKTKTPPAKKAPKAQPPETTANSAQRSAPIPEGVRKKIDTSLIDPHPHNRKIDPKTCRGLAATMLEFGQIEPATVRPHPTKPGRYQLGAGERRWIACGINKTPLDCIIRELSDAEIEGMLVIENNQRENPDPRHEAGQIRRFIKAHPDADSHQIAAILGREESWVKRRLRLTDLIEPLHEAWLDPENDIHSTSVASMELLAALTPDLQTLFLEEFTDSYDSIAHKDVIHWISHQSCSLEKATWLENPATFVPGCGPGGCATSSAATDLFNATEFADRRESKCAQCLNPSCFSKRQALFRTHSWQTAIAKAPEGYYTTTDRYSDQQVTLADGSTLKPRSKHDFSGWKSCKKTDPNAKPFIEESNDTVKLTWKLPPAAFGLPGRTITVGQTTIKSAEETLQASIDRLQGKRYTLVLDELRDHVEKAPLPEFKDTPITLVCLASTFGTISRRETIWGDRYHLDDDHDEESDAGTPARNLDDGPMTDDEDNDSDATTRTTPWQTYRDLNPTWHITRLWRSIRSVLAWRLRDRSFTDKKSTLIKPEFINEMKEIATLTGFDFPASYLRSVQNTKLPAALKDHDPVTLAKK